MCMLSPRRHIECRLDPLAGDIPPEEVSMGVEGCTGTVQAIPWPVAGTALTPEGLRGSLETMETLT